MSSSRSISHDPKYLSPTAPRGKRIFNETSQNKMRLNSDLFTSDLGRIVQTSDGRAGTIVISRIDRFSTARRSSCPDLLQMKGSLKSSGSHHEFTMERKPIVQSASAKLVQHTYAEPRGLERRPTAQSARPVLHTYAEPRGLERRPTVQSARPVLHTYAVRSGVLQTSSPRSVDNRPIVQSSSALSHFQGPIIKSRDCGAESELTNENSASSPSGHRKHRMQRSKHRIDKKDPPILNTPRRGAGFCCGQNQGNSRPSTDTKAFDLRCPVSHKIDTAASPDIHQTAIGSAIPRSFSLYRSESTRGSFPFCSQNSHRVRRCISENSSRQSSRNGATNGRSRRRRNRLNRQDDFRDIREKAICTQQVVKLKGGSSWSRAWILHQRATGRSIDRWLTRLTDSQIDSSVFLNTLDTLSDQEFEQTTKSRFSGLFSPEEENLISKVKRCIKKVGLVDILERPVDEYSLRCAQRYRGPRIATIEDIGDNEEMLSTIYPIREDRREWIKGLFDNLKTEFALNCEILKTSESLGNSSDDVGLIARRLLLNVLKRHEMCPIAFSKDDWLELVEVKCLLHHIDIGVCGCEFNRSKPIISSIVPQGRDSIGRPILAVHLSDIMRFLAGSDSGGPLHESSAFEAFRRLYFFWFETLRGFCNTSDYKIHEIVVVYYMDSHLPNSPRSRQVFSNLCKEISELYPGGVGYVIVVTGDDSVRAETEFFAKEFVASTVSETTYLQCGGDVSLIDGPGDAAVLRFPNRLLEIRFGGSREVTVDDDELFIRLVRSMSTPVAEGLTFDSRLRELDQLLNTR